MANDTTNTTTNFDIEYPTNGYDATPTWAELYGAAFEDIDSALAERLVEEEVEDVVGALLAGGDKVGLTYDDANDQLTIDTTALDEEEVEDAVDSLLTGGNAITTSYDDGNDQLTLAVDESAISHDGIDQSTVSSDDHHTRYSDSEASDAAPVQSVFGRVGQVAAQAGDYAASQITNFGSAVIGAIDGSDITPSSVDTPSVSADDLDIGGTDLYRDGDFVAFKTFNANQRVFSTTSTSYVSDDSFFGAQLDSNDLPSAHSDIQTFVEIDGRTEPVDVRLRDTLGSETIFEILDKSTLEFVTRVDSAPSGNTRIRFEIRADDGDNNALIRRPNIALGVQL